MMDAHINLAKEYAMTTTRRPSKEDTLLDQEVVPPTTEFSSIETSEDATKEVAAKLAAAQLDEAGPGEEVQPVAAEAAPEEKKEDIETAEKAVEVTPEAVVTVTPPVEEAEAPAPVQDPLLNPSIAAGIALTTFGRRTPPPAMVAPDLTAEAAQENRPGM
jgi:hypothetical protein